MAPNTNHWKNDKKYNGLLNYIIKRTENVESPMSIHQLVTDFKKKSGDAQTTECLRFRAYKIRTVIHRIEHIDKNTKVKVLFALSAPVDANFLKHLQKDALVKVDENKRIAHYKSNDGSLELKGDHSPSEKRSLLNIVFKNKNDADAVPKNDEEKEMRNFIEFITEKCENINYPLNITQLTKDFNKQFGTSRAFSCIQRRIRGYCHKIQKTEFLDIHTKVRQLFGLSATVDSDYLKKLRKDAIVEIDDKNRIIHYTANDRSLVLRGDHSQSAKIRTAHLESKRSLRSLIINHFETKGDADATPQNEEEKEMGNLIEFITEKCANVDTPLSIHQLVKHFNNRFGISVPSGTIDARIRGYCREIQKAEFLDTRTKLKQLFCLSARVDSDYLEKLREEAVVEVDDLNRITKYTANDSRLILYGDHSRSAKQRTAQLASKRRHRSERKKNKKRVKKHCTSSDDKEDGCSEEDSDEYSSEEFDSEFDSDDEKSHLDDTEDLMEPSNKAVEFDNETPVRSRSPVDMPIDDNFDFDPPTERTHRSEKTRMREDDEKDDPEITGDAVVEPQRSESFPKSKTSSSTSHTTKTPKRKVDASAGSSSSKRTKPLPKESMHPGNSNDNIFHDDPPRVKLEPFRGLLKLPNGIEEDPDIQQIPKPRPQVLEAPIKEEYEEESQTSLQTVLKAFKSLTLSLDNSGLLQFLMELDTKIMESGSEVEVSNKEVIMAMDFLIVKLSKHGALKSSEDSISLRDIFLMLRTIVLNSSFNGLEVILEMLKENIIKLKVLDKKVPVSKVDTVLRATLDSIST
ncbi:unnamed protein product [Caenorhabditis brenneri]